MKLKIFYWVPNGLLLLLMVGSALYYVTNTADVVIEFTELGYPAYSMWFNAGVCWLLVYFATGYVF